MRTRPNRKTVASRPLCCDTVAILKHDAITDIVIAHVVKSSSGSVARLKRARTLPVHPRTQCRVL